MARLSSVTLENFRTFRTRTTLDLAPLTLITGPNSSGKSSVLKALQLLRHNAVLGRLHRPTFAGGGHNLGSFRNVCSRGSQRTDVTIGLSFDWGDFESGEAMWAGHDGSSHSSNFKVGHANIELTYGDVADVWIAVGADDDLIASHTHPDYGLDRFVLATGKGGARPMLEVQIETEVVTYEAEGMMQNAAGEEVPVSHPVDQVQHYYAAVLHGEWFFESAEKAYAAFGFPEDRPSEAVQAAKWLSGPLHVRLDALNVFNDTPTLETFVQTACAPDGWSDVRAGEQQVAFPAQNPFLVHALKELFLPYYLRWTGYFTDQIAALNHTGALRATQQRLYPDAAEDPFTRLLYAYTRPSRSKEEAQRKRDDLPALLKEYGVGDSLRVERVADAAYAVQVLRGDHPVHLADLGYGYTQLLPLLLYAVSVDKDDSWDLSLLVEEPEANLHPNLQARLADLFVRLTEDGDFNVLAETHSEYLVRRLQYLAAKGLADPDQVAVYYLGADSNADDYVRRITISPQGRLSEEFGTGFLDEATSLMVALFQAGSAN